MNQRCSPAPILVGRVGEKDFGHDLVGRCLLEESRVGERRDVCWEEHRRGRLRIARGLGETVVETAAAGPGYVSENTVKRDPSFLIRIKALVEEVAQEAPVLRNALSINTLCRGDGFGIMLGVGSKV